MSKVGITGLRTYVFRLWFIVYRVCVPRLLAKERGFIVYRLWFIVSIPKISAEEGRFLVYCFSFMVTDARSFQTRNEKRETMNGFFSFIVSYDRSFRTRNDK